MDKRKEFLQKLHDLLNEYDVSIDAGYEGDTHGIHGEHITINHRPNKNFLKEAEWFRADYQMYLTAHDIKEEI